MLPVLEAPWQMMGSMASAAAGKGPLPSQGVIVCVGLGNSGENRLLMAFWRVHFL